jgi:RND family efflux transporter MFP subunit
MRRLLLASLLGVVGAGGILAWTRGTAIKAASGTRGEAQETVSEGTEKIRVEVVHPRKGGMMRTSAQTGSVDAFEKAELYAKVSGYLKTLSVDIGDHVKEGQVLAEIDNPEQVKERDRDAATLEEARAAVRKAESRVKTAEADLEAAEAELAKAGAEVDRYASARSYREKELARFKVLFRQHALQQQAIDEEEEHYESALAAEHSARAAVISTQAQVVSAQAMVEQARADLVEARANVEVAKSDLDKSQVLVDYSRIISPYDGVVTFRGFHRGAFIRSAEEGTVRPILTVARTDKLRVVTYIPDRDVPFTDVGDRALITLTALPGEVFEGKVSRLAETEDPQSRTMRTEIDLWNPKNRLREGMYGIATILLQESSGSLTVPTFCLSDKSKGNEGSVFVVRDGKAKLVPVKIGADDGVRVEIVSGLRPEDDVVLNPGLVTDGTPVEPIAAGTSAAAKAGPV